MFYSTDVVNAMRMVDDLRLKERMLVVVSNLNQDMLDQAGPALMSGVVGTDTWMWRVSEREHNVRGKRFVAHHSARYQLIPPMPPLRPAESSSNGQTPRSMLAARNHSAVIAALEDHSYRLLKDKQKWRALDHQYLQGMYEIEVTPRAEMLKDELK